MRRLLRSIALLCVPGLMSVSALAQTSVVTFDDLAKDAYAENFVSGGFRFSPRCHADIVDREGVPGG